MITILTDIARERERKSCKYSVCIELVPSSDTVVMGNIKQTSSSYDKSPDTYTTQLDLVSL